MPSNCRISPQGQADLIWYLWNSDNIFKVSLIQQYFLYLRQSNLPVYSETFPSIIIIYSNEMLEK